VSARVLLLHLLHNIFGPEFAVPFLEPVDLLNVKLKIQLEAVGDVGGLDDAIDVSGIPTYQHTDFHMIRL